MQTFIVTDPRTFDGDPFDVAKRACAQAEALINLAVKSTNDAFVMARNAEMERQLLDSGRADAPAFENGPYGRQFKTTEESLKHAAANLRLLGKAAGFNPRAPLSKE